MRERKSSAESFAEAEKALGLIGELTPDVKRVPRPEDDELGPSLFRTRVEKATLSRLTLPGLVVGRSELVDVSLLDSELRFSNLCWSDYHSCSFASSSLADSDLRCSNFDRCSFRGADLSRVDLRRSSFKQCDFEGAEMQGAIANDDFKGMARLSAAQSSSIAWTPDQGAEPSGG